MTSRREFVAGAGALFVGCSLFPHAHAQTKRREVRVAGKRIRTIDVHAHCVIPEAQALMKQKPPADYAKTFPERLKDMDEQGVDMQALSINPMTSVMINDGAQVVTRNWPARFGQPAVLHAPRPYRSGMTPSLLLPAPLP